MYRPRQHGIETNHHKSRYKNMHHETLRPARGRIGKTRKTEGSSNITSKRLTIHPGFLSLGSKSETARKDIEQEHLCQEEKSILNEDLHGLFNVKNSKDSPAVRRSARILRKKAKKDIDRFTASSYYELIDSSVSTSSLDSQDRSKSLFQKINEKYDIVQNKSEGRIFRVRIANVDFCSRLQTQVHSSFLKLKAVVYCRSKIFKMTEEITQVLTGKVPANNDMTPLSPQVNIANESFRFNNMNFDFFPSNQWVYMTPPRQRLHAPRLDDCVIEPAVIYTTRKASAVYGMKSNVCMDLRNFENKQQVPLDHRYLQHLGDCASLQQANDGEQISMDGCFITSGQSTSNFNFLRPSISNQPSCSQVLISRPQKTVQKLSRLETAKRKLDQCYEYIDSPPFLDGLTPMRRNVVQQQSNDEAMDSSQQEGDFQFGFKKRLFNLEKQANMFSFNIDSPKMFNFSKLNSKD